MKIRKIILGILFIVGVFVAIGCSNATTGKVVHDTQQPIRVGLLVQPSNTLLMVAKDKGFFEQEGLNIEFSEFTAGKFAFQAFLARSLDISVSAEVPAMLASLQGNEFYIISQIVERTNNEIRIVAFREDVLTEPERYFKAKRRKLATSFGTGAEFYTYQFIKKHKITDIELISQKPEDMPVALQTGTIDAVAVFEPFALFAEQKLGNKSITFTDDKLYSELFILSAKKEWIEANPEIIENFLRALVKSSEFIEKNPEESKEIVMKYTRLDKKSIDSIWSNFVFKPVLNSLIIKHMDEQSHWAIDTGKVSNTTKIPEFNDYIYKDALKKINPKYVTI